MKYLNEKMVLKNLSLIVWNTVFGTCQGTEDSKIINRIKIEK